MSSWWCTPRGRSLDDSPHSPLAVEGSWLVSCSLTRSKQKVWDRAETCFFLLVNTILKKHISQLSEKKILFKQLYITAVQVTASWPQQFAAWNITHTFTVKSVSSTRASANLCWNCSSFSTSWGKKTPCQHKNWWQHLILIH